MVFYEKPFVKFDRLLETYLAFAPKGFPNFAKAMPLWIKEKLFKVVLVECLNKTISGGVDWNERIHFSEHHLSHAASAFFPSPFERAAVLTLDGVGEWTTSSLAVGEGNEMTVLKEIRFPHSWDCCTLPSPTISASRSIPVNTKSWGSRRMASRVMST